MLVATSPQPIAIVEAFSDIADKWRSKGKRHEVAICLASFTLAVAAGNQGFIAIGDWLKAYREELISLLKTEKARIPSYSTIRRVLLTLDYQKYREPRKKDFVNKKLVKTNYLTDSNNGK